jgi:hypothetical protein
VNLDLTSVRAKLARSQEHAQTVEDEIRAWMDRHPYGLTKEVNADHTRYSLILRENEPAPLRRWTLGIADAFHNLRTVLDYLVYEVAIVDSGSKNPPPHDRCLQFPISDTPDDFSDAVRRRLLGEISAPVRATFELMQPYNRPHPTLPPLLRILRELNNTDKHRMLRLAYGAVSKGNLGFKGEFPSDGRQWKHVINTGEVKDGTEVTAMVCDRSTPNMDWDQILVEVVIAIWHGKRDPSGPDWTDHTEWSAVFQAVSEEVRVVIARFVGGM